MNKHKIIVSVSGASGAIYTKVLFDKLQQLNKQIETVGVLMSDNAKYVWETELGNKDYESLLIKLSDTKESTDNFFDNVVVNDENHNIKNNRLELLKMFCNTFDNFIDFSKLEGL